MMSDICKPPSSLNLAPSAPYNLSSAASASSSTTSFWSDTSSQHSDDTVSTGLTSLSDSRDLYSGSHLLCSSQTSNGCLGTSLRDTWAKPVIQPQTHVEFPAQLRQNPRRTSTSATSRTGRPPSLVRQTDRKLNFVENLVDTSTHIVEAIWPTSSVRLRNSCGNSSVLPLRTFIQETLRRSRTSYSTLQVALYYLILIKPHVPAYDFTTEQPDDRRCSQAIQCGRRMFLAALILASKYLQDRNYSTRAWSKISGLDTFEINQNEMTFLLAVNWNLHVTEEIYKRWADCVSKFTPTQPPSPGGPAHQLYERQCYDFRRIILNLSPELENLEELVPWSPATAYARETNLQSPFTPAVDRTSIYGFDAAETHKAHAVPAVLEPAPTLMYAPGRLAPALGLLPTPRLTPQSIGLNTPAASAVSGIQGRSSSMCFAMAQASAALAAHSSVDRWSPSATSSPMSYVTRRSSLANSVSTASSPESMVSDSSRISRSSSISSASSVNAPSTRMDVQARYRYPKLCGDRLSVRPTIASVPEDQEDAYLTRSPESYAVMPGNEFRGMAAETPLARREREMDDAARALQELQRSGAYQAPTHAKTGFKRSRAFSAENPVQEDVREMLSSHYRTSACWPETMVRGPTGVPAETQQVPLMRGSYKRICCSTEAARPHKIPALHPAVGGYGGPGMWDGILN